jgi:hypothetical protein
VPSRVIMGMSKERHNVSLTHRGYMAGLNGEDPDELDSRCEEYELGWLAGAEDREKGFQVPKYFGPCDLPIRRGAEVTIPKGTPVKRGRTVQVTRRAYKVKLHDVYPGSPAYVEWDSRRAVTRPTAARVLWAGAGSLWAEAFLSDIVIGEEVPSESTRD